MLIINKIIKSNIFFIFENISISLFLKTIIIKKKFLIKNKKIVNILKKRIYNKKYFFSYLKKKIKSGFYIEKYFLPNSLTNIHKKTFKKIIYFEFIFKNIKNNILTRKIIFKKKKCANLKIKKNYIGIIKNVINYGIFVDIGNFDGLLHISDIPLCKRIYKKIFTKNLLIVKITKFDKKIKKISFNLKKNYKKKINIFLNVFLCKIKKINVFLNCFNNYNNNYIIKNNNLNYKINDIIKIFYIKKNNNIIISSQKYKLKKNNKKYIKLILKYKISKFYFYIYKNNKYITKYKNKILKIKNINYYKYYISKIINNDFYKIIFIKNLIFIKMNNFYLKIKLKKKITIINIKIIKKKIYFFYKKY